MQELLGFGWHYREDTPSYKSEQERLEIFQSDLSQGFSWCGQKPSRGRAGRMDVVYLLRIIPRALCCASELSKLIFAFGCIIILAVHHVFNTHTLLFLQIRQQTNVNEIRQNWLIFLESTNQLLFDVTPLNSDLIQLSCKIVKVLENFAWDDLRLNFYFSLALGVWLSNLSLHTQKRLSNHGARGFQSWINLQK